MHPSLWVREAAELGAEPQPFPERADVAVIGGGIAGVSTALALARAGVEVVLLEAGRIATRASGRNDGQLLLGLGEHYNRIVGQFGAERARALWAFIERNNRGLKAEIEDLGLDCGLCAGGGLRLAETAHEALELDEAAALLAAEGIAHERLDAVALAAVFPAGAGFHGALRLPGEAIVQPAAMVRGLAQAARAGGARIFEEAAVRSVAEADGGSTLQLADGRRLRTSMVVHCTSTLARDLDPSGFLAAQLFPFRGQILATGPLPPEIAAGFPPAAMSSNFCYEYFRIHERRFVVGGMRWAVPGEQLGILDDAGHDERVSAKLGEYVDRHFPALRGVPFPHVWTGIMAGTADGLPLCGPLPGRSGTFALCGFNGYGLSFAFEAGRTLAEWIVEGRAQAAAAAMFAPRRFG
jgi:glycine/D-amino acid oxidase-like deaminating enzyme